MHQQKLISILDELNATSADISASMVISNDGLALALAGAAPQGSGEDRLGALGAALLHSGHEAMESFAGGELEQVAMQGKLGCILVIPTCRELGLVVLASPHAELELIFVEMQRVANNIRQVFYGADKPSNNVINLVRTYLETPSIYSYGCR